MKYKIIYQKNDKIKSKLIQTHNLENEILPENIIEIKKQSISFNELFEQRRISDKELKMIFYELSLMLNSKILFDDALNILIKNQKNNLSKEFLETIKSSFSNSIDIVKSLEEYKINFLVKSFFKITQDSGNTAENIKSLSNLISDEYEVKRDFIKLMIYPMVLFFTFFISLFGIFKFVVPKFEFMFSQISFELSFATKSLFFVKDLYENYFFVILCLILFTFFLSIFIYKNNSKIRYKIDKLLVENLYIFSSIYKLKNLYLYFTVIDLLLSSKYEINESISRAKVLMNNKYLLDRITQIENLLKSGRSIHWAFTQVNLFDDVALSLIRTGELTNSLDITIKEIKSIYKTRFDEKLKLFSQMIEPIFFIIITSLIVWIILAVFVPIWSMGDMLKV
ncbi:type II secretion system F family protein [Arcobacter sp. LA11]|uniref:type II secretion system F family protein n=1 Tax=Arcobacter sp. LA11 TaxID=1898176 RepID=UPI0009FB5FC8|nr:type II secretion system F family protein [Arcobacter sp. LA11]